MLREADVVATSVSVIRVSRAIEESHRDGRQREWRQKIVMMTKKERERVFRTV